MRKRRIAALGMAALTASALFAGCGEEKSEGLDVAVITRYALEEENPLPSALAEELPDLPCNVVTIATGDAETDPTVAMAGMMRLTALISSKDVDIVVANTEEAERQARAESFTPLSELFTEEELTGFEQISFSIVSDDGTVGNLSNVPCGVRLNAPEIASMDESGMGLYVICNTEEPELAKEVFLLFAELYAE